MVGEAKPEHPLPPRRPPLTRRQLLMQAVVASVILASGIGIGAGGTILALKDRIIPWMRLPPPDMPPGPEPNDLVNRWRDDYGLSEKQTQQVKDVLTKQFAAMRELRQKSYDTERSEREKFAGAIKKIFTPEQFTKWQQDLEERAKHWQRMRSFEGRGGGRGGPRGERGPGRPMDPDGRRGGRPPDGSISPEGRRMDGPPRPFMDTEGRRGNWPSRGPVDPNSHRKDRPADRPMELNNRPGDVNGPR